MNRSLSSSPSNTSCYHYERVAYGNPTMSSTENVSYYNEIQMDDGKWTRDQTQILIDTWKEHKATLLNTAASSAEHFRVWKLIANEVNKLSPPKSLQQCKKKFRNIRYICKTAMNNNKQAGAKKHYPMFYSDFVEIIAETERLKDTMRSDHPNVEIIRDASADSISMDYPSIEVEEHSPPHHHEQQNGVIIKVEDLQNKNKPKNLLRTKNISSFNSTDGSFHDSPRSHESEHTPSYHGGESSASPSVGAPEDRTENDETAAEHRECRTDELYHDENRSYLHSDVPIRKHKHDVSIMGRGYPPLKRTKRTSEVMFPVTNQQYLSPIAPSIMSAAIHSEPYPTMASIQQTDETFPVSSNDISSNYTSGSYTSTTKKYSVSSYSTTKEPTSFLNVRSISQQNGYTTRTLPSLITGASRDYSFRGNSFQRDNSFNTSYNDRFNDRFLDVQERQMELFSDMLNRHEQFLLRLLEQQRVAAEEAQQRDREFMLKLIEMFVKNKNN